MGEFLQQLINGLALGSVYALIALGYSMVYGIIRLINFAHGDIIMVGAYAAFLSFTYFDFGFISSLLLAMLVCALTGVIIERLAYKPLRQAPRIAALITAIGVSLLLQNGFAFIFGPQQRSFPNFLETRGYSLGGVLINSDQLIIFFLSLLLMVLLEWIVKNTSTGRAMRAVSFDREAAQLMGVNINRTISTTFALGSALAAAAGVLLGIYYKQFDPFMGFTPGLKAFIAAVLGGIGVIPGALIGGFVMGFAEVLAVAAGYSTFKDGVAFVLLILILLLRPRGILGEKEMEKA